MFKNCDFSKCVVAPYFPNGAAHFDVPPKMTDIYYVAEYEEKHHKYCVSRSILEKGGPNFNVKKTFCDAKSVDEIKYADLATAVTQRHYDYHEYFMTYIATDPNDIPAYNAALDQLLDVFSPNLTEFTVKTNGTQNVSFSNRDGARTFFTAISNASPSTAFAGYTQHNALNVRVRPIFNSFSCQAATTSHLFQFIKFNVLGFAVDSGEYNITWVLEKGVWRIKTWIFNDRLTYPITPIIAPPEYQPPQPIQTSCKPNCP